MAKVRRSGVDFGGVGDVGHQIHESLEYCHYIGAAINQNGQAVVANGSGSQVSAARFSLRNVDPNCAV